MIKKRNVMVLLVSVLVISCFGQVAMEPLVERVEYSIKSFEKPLNKSIKQDFKKMHTLIFKDTVIIDSVAWMQLEFSDYYLGEESYILVKSIKDGIQQRLDRFNLEQLQNATDIIRGDKCIVSLFQADCESGIYFTVNKVITGQQETVSMLKLCDRDDRVRILDSRIGRLVRGTTNDQDRYGTVWLASNGVLLTAGHTKSVEPSTASSVEFNIKSSGSDGKRIKSDPEDIYPIDYSTLSYRYDKTRLGNDWCVFRCLPNPITGLLPHQAQNNFFRMTKDIPNNTSDIRVTGNGVDSIPYGTSGKYNSSNQTTQTDIGPYFGEITIDANHIYHTYRVDTEGNNSGSPIVWESNSFTIGIHTGGSCHASSSATNRGTSFENNSLESAIQNIYGPYMVYVDNQTISSTEDGAIFTPYNSISEGIQAASAYGKLFITTGVYNETININHSIVIYPPACGSVIVNP